MRLPAPEPTPLHAARRLDPIPANRRHQIHNHRRPQLPLALHHRGRVVEEPIARLLPLARLHLRLRPPMHLHHPRVDPQPLHRLGQAVVMREQVEQESARRQAREHLRVLYVAWTRARDRLILAGSAKHTFTNALTVLRDDRGPLLAAPDGPGTTWAGSTLDVPTSSPPALEPQPRSTEASPTHALPEDPQPWPVAYRTPSQCPGEAEILETVELGPAMEVHGHDGPELGEAFHAFIAADHGDDRPARERNAARTLTAWDTGRPDLAPTFVDAADRLTTFLHDRFPGTAVHKEVPLSQRPDYATGLRGFVDLWIPGHAIVDHKVLLGTRERQQATARTYAGQLDAYARATGGNPQRWVHLPLAGLMVRLGRPEHDLGEVF